MQKNVPASLTILLLVAALGGCAISPYPASPYLDFGGGGGYYSDPGPDPYWDGDGDGDSPSPQPSPAPSDGTPMLQRGPGPVMSQPLSPPSPPIGSGASVKDNTADQPPSLSPEPVPRLPRVGRGK